MGLIKNVSKAKILIFERNEEKMECKISVNGKIEQVNEVIYLGSIFSRDGRYEKDVEMRIAVINRVSRQQGVLAALMRRRHVSTTA